MAVLMRGGGEPRWPRVGEVDWLSPAELVREGFARSRVVMMNEAVSGKARSIRTRRVGTDILPIAWAAGARLLAVESMGPPGGEPPHPEVIEQPDMAELLATARRLGFRVTGYDADGGAIPLKLRIKRKSPGFTNWRDGTQATNLTALLNELPPDDRMLVWAENRHNSKVRYMTFQPTGWRFRIKSGVDPFVIDQTVTVNFTKQRRLTPLQEWAYPEIRRRRGDAGFIWRDGMPRLSPGSDAWILSLDNELE
jgi:hypothetical protein